MDIGKHVRKKVDKLTYDKSILNSKVVQIQKSFDEVNQMINGKKEKK